MVNLTLNEEKVRKILMRYPNGVKAKILLNECFISKTPLYVALNRLEEKDLAFRGNHNLWYPENPMCTRNDISYIELESAEPKIIDDKPATQNSGLGFWGLVDRRAERHKQQLEREKRELDADIARRREIALVKARNKNWNQDKKYAIIKKWRKYFKLD